MEEDLITAQIDNEIKDLQTGLKDRLKETEDLGDLGKQVSRSTFSLEEHTSSLKNTSYRIKVMKMLECYKYFLIAFAFVGLILFMIYRSYFYHR